MIRLLYISTSRKRPSRKDMDDILTVSRRNNAAAEITGLLIAGGNRFLQVLEGPDAAVQLTYDRICRDPRHFAPVVLKRERVDERLFGAWTMGFQPGGALNQSARVSDQVSALVSPIDDVILRAYFEGFALQHAT